MLSHVRLCDSLHCSLPGSSIHGVFQARILEWVAVSSPGDLPDPGIKPSSLMSPALADGFFTTNVTWEIEFKTKQSKYGLTKINTHLHFS